MRFQKDVEQIEWMISWYQGQRRTCKAEGLPHLNAAINRLSLLLKEKGVAVGE